MIENSLVEEVKLLASRLGTYTIYVFENLKSKKLIMCTRLPHWDSPEIPIGAKGFLEYRIVKAGEVYYDPTKDNDIKYRYSNVYFNNFIFNTDSVINNDIIL